MKYVTMMIELHRRGVDANWGNTIFAVVTPEEYQCTVDKHMAYLDEPVLVKTARGFVTFVPREAIAIHCGPERDAP